MASVVWRKGAGLNKCKLLPAPFQAYLNNTDNLFGFVFLWKHSFCLLYFHAFHFVLYVDMSEIKLKLNQILYYFPSTWTHVLIPVVTNLPLTWVCLSVHQSAVTDRATQPMQIITWVTWVTWLTWVTWVLWAPHLGERASHNHNRNLLIWLLGHFNLSCLVLVTQ